MDTKQKKQIATIGLIIVLVCFGLFIAIKALIGNSSNETDGPIYSTAEVLKGNIEVGVKAKGMLQPTYGGQIGIPPITDYSMPSVRFIVDEVLVKEGDAVTQGQLLIKFASPDLENTLKTNREDLDSLLTELSEISGKPKSQVETINPARGIVLTAPIDGRVTGLNISEGDTIDVGHIIANIINDSKFRVKAKLTTGEVAQVKKGSPVKLFFPNFDGGIDGIVTSVSSAAMPNSNSTGFVYVAYIEADNPGLVQQGMSVTVGVPNSDATSFAYFKNPATVDEFLEEEKLLNKAKETIVTDVFVDDFESVKKGDPIVTLSGDVMQEKIRQQLDQVRRIKRTISELEKQFSNLEVYSSMNGIISRLETKVGQEINQWDAQYLGNINNSDRMMLYIQVDDIDIVNVIQGAPVSVTVDAMPGESFEGSVMNVSSYGNQSGGITKFDVNIEVTGGIGLRPGMQATAYIDAGRSENVFLIPVEAIFDENGKQMVEVLENGVPKLAEVTLGLMNDRYAEVLEGLTEGQLVITGSSSDLLPSEHIQADDSLIPSNGGADDDDSNGNNK